MATTESEPEDGRRFLERLEAAIPAVQRWVQRRRGVAVLGRESSADLVQSICREALMARHGYEHGGDAQFQGWLKTLADRKLKDRVRHWSAARREVGRTVSLNPPPSPGETGGLDDSGSGGADFEGFEPPPDLVAEAAELEERIIAAIEALSSTQRAVLEMGRVGGLSTAEIASKVGKSESAIRTCRSRALALIAEAL